MILRRAFAVFVAVGLTGLALAASPNWMRDLEAAKAKAAKERKPLLVEFTGSTWCPPCKALAARVLSSPEFAAFAERVVLVSLDYPTLGERSPDKVRANPDLARLMGIKEKYQVPGFPTLILLDADGKQLSKIVGYAGEPAAAYLAKLNAPGK